MGKGRYDAQHLHMALSPPEVLERLCLPHRGMAFAWEFDLKLEYLSGVF